MRELLSHTADLRATISASSLSELYGEAVALVREIVVGDCPVEPRERRRLALAHASESERLYRFLRELVYLVDSERFLPAAAELTDGAVEVEGELFDADRHVAERQLKAITRHRFELEREGERWRCSMVFDL